MADDSFSFRQFAVRQARAAMKVGTDGVILGAWFDAGDPSARILDVGTGTGLIALMAAQRNPSARIDAVEIDAASCDDAAENFAASPWSGRLSLYRESFSDFCSRRPARYDRIVSNPPYFEESLKSPDRARATARHADSLPFAELAAGAVSLLASDGRLAVILPPDAAARFAMQAVSCGLFRMRRLDIYPVPGGALRRVCLEFSVLPETELRSSLCLHGEGRIGYSAEYKSLSGDFYLRM